MPATLSPEMITEKQGQFVRCAVKILETDGLDALTLRRLATQTGVSRTTPYLYFKDKAALLDMMRVHGFNLLADECEAATFGCEEYIEKLRLLGETYFDFAIQRPALYQLIFECDRNYDVSEALTQAMDRYSQLSEIPMQQAFDAGVISLPPDRLNPVLWAAIHGLLTLRSAGLVGNDAAFAKIRADTMQILATGFMVKDSNQR